MSNLIEKSLSVYCPECKDGKAMKQITHKHLKKHNLTLDQFRDKYPDCYTIHPTREEQLKEARRKGKAKKEKRKVTKPCWNYVICNNKVEDVNINVGSIYVICKECKSNGLVHPSLQKHKQKMSERAKNLNKDPEIIQKRTESLRNRTPEEIESWKNKREKTLIKKDGEDWKKIQHEKIKAGMLKIYGEEHALKVPEFLDQAQTTHFLRTGVINPMELQENVDKVFEQRDQEKITEKTIDTNMEKWGGRGPMCSPEVVEKANKTRLKNFLPKLYIFLEKVGLELLDEYNDCYTYNSYRCLKCKTVFKSDWNQISQGRHCPSCSNKFGPSKAEDEIYDFLLSIGIDNISRSDRNLLKPYEIDLLIHSHKLCIEHCGLYTHRDDVLRDTRKKMNDVTLYHSYKLDQCLKRGYQLLTIFEDEWMFKRNIVESMLKQRLGKNENKKVDARKCDIYEITFETKRDFLEAYHIQGNDNSQIMLGAFSKEDELVAVMTFAKPSIAKGSGVQKVGHWELSRFCTDYNYRVPGGAGKLLKYFQRNFDWTYIYSFADRRWSLGNLYHQLGFTLETDLLKIKPNYWYIDCNKLKRVHRYTLRKKKDDPQDITEKMLRVSQGYHILYDCGNLKFSITK